MSVDSFIPELWHGSIFKAYEKEHVFAGLANREYEGEISKFGDTVHVNEIGAMSATAYTGSVTYSDVDSAQKTLKIDKQYYIARQLDDVDKYQTNPKLMNEIARKAAAGMSDQVDQDLAALYTQAGITDGTTASPDSVTSANVIDKLSEMAQAFKENNVPTADRVAVVHPWFVHKLRLAGVDLKTDNTSVYENGSIGNVMGWQIYESNNAANSSTTWYANYFFRRSETLALAMQVVTNEALRLESKIGDGWRWLNVYGCKVMAPESLGILYATNGAES